ncbi:D-alanyl-D-alanine carboxypeptidase family protein [Thermomonospora umbrina]|uniref:D-alanyl-D-alanine carboxypeptidase n=1 Tax=Thermomonospora umbrina TaxID=111806 RepID=A0A3D9SRU8_9ACTN|nr:D-alanyl-D-alanine carboxypeptidase [Thermomonospora umbrina]REE98538.1 D-alanyl-D-alanine carboxypeptidase [Thermomonospora umbrina]
MREGSEAAAVGRSELEPLEQVFWEAPAAPPVTRVSRLPALPAADPEFRPYQPQHAAPAQIQAPLSEGPQAVVPPEEDERRRRRWPLVAVLMVVVLLAAAGAVQFFRPLPEPAMRLTLPASHTFRGDKPVLPLPQGGQAVVGVEGIGTMGRAGAETPIPTASVAKVMTAYLFLKNHPLAPGEDGPTFTISPQEAARLKFRKQRGESHVDVTAGQRFTERKALEALMVVSANNLAHELARWDAGSLEAYVAKMNTAARELGMTNTRYTDPSGYDSGTVSTAADQVKLLRAAMAIPAFAEIVALRTYVPNDGGPDRPAGNVLLGRNGIVGGKTGYTDAAGGNFVFAAKRRVAGIDTLLIGAVMGQQGSSAVAAMTVAEQLAGAAQGALTGATLARAGQTAAEIDDGLGKVTPVAAGAPITVVGWPGLTVPVALDGTPPDQGARGEEVGAVVVGDGSGEVRFPLRLPRALKEPDLVTRLTRLG